MYQYQYIIYDNTYIIFENTNGMSVIFTKKKSKYYRITRNNRTKKHRQTDHFHFPNQQIAIGPHRKDPCLSCSSIVHCTHIDTL